METLEIVKRLMKTLTEDEHPLVTPNFIGTDEEKVIVLGYWSEVIGLMRSMNSIVVSHDNKLAIIAQLKAELEIINNEVNNVTSHQVQHADGSVELSTMPAGGELPKSGPVAPATPVPTSTTPAPKIIDLGQPENKFNPKVSTTEAMQRLAGTYYASKAAKKK